MADLRLGAHDALRHGRRWREKSAGDFLGGEAANFAQGEGDLGFRCQRRMAASENQVLGTCEFIKESVFDLLPELQSQGQLFDIVIADPPAFVKQAQHKGAGLRGYQKLAKQCAQLVAPNGLLFMASCSHHAQTQEFRQAIETGITKAGRTLKFIRKGGADKDHPIHPLLPENHYLKALLYQLD